jgi:hypothetical protein
LHNAAGRTGRTTGADRDVLVVLVVTAVAVVHMLVTAVAFLVTLLVAAIVVSVPAAPTFGIGLRSGETQCDRRGDDRQSKKFSRHRKILSKY